MKKLVINILCSTGATLILSAAAGMLFGAHFLCIDSVFQALSVNAVIHLGLLITHKFESSYAALEFVLDICCVTAAAVSFGALFDWYGSTPLWLLVLMAVMIYFISVLLNLVRTHKRIEEINRLLKKRSGASASISKEEK